MCKLYFTVCNNYKISYLLIALVIVENYFYVYFYEPMIFQAVNLVNVWAIEGHGVSHTEKGCPLWQTEIKLLVSLKKGL